MADLQCWELAKSGKTKADLRSRSIAFDYFVMRSYDKSAVYTFMLDYTSIPPDGLIRSDISLDPQGGGVWLVSVTYENNILGPEFSFDTTGGTQHITQSKETIDSVKYGIPTMVSEPDDFERAIGVSKEGVKGVDIISPKLEFTINVSFPSVSLSYVKTLRYLTGKVNNATFLGFDKGELLFLGGQGSSQDNGTLRAGLKFAAAPNQEDIDLVPDDDAGNHLLRIPTKEGWYYLWCAYGQKFAIPDGGTVSKRVTRPIAAYVERVYEYADFEMLGL